jgi:diguanylate cyclase (GGDEF)-like protein
MATATDLSREKVAHPIAEPAAGSRAPRFALRFAVITALGLALGGAAILLFVRQDEIARSEQTVRFHAQFVAQAVLQNELRPSDLRSPIDSRRRRQLDGFFLRHVLVGGTIGASIYSPTGRLAYSNLATAPRSSVDRTRLLAAVGGASSATAALVPNGAGAKFRVLESFVPLATGPAGPRGALVLYQDYAPIASAAWHAVLPVVGVLEAVLVGLYLLLLPLLRRTSLRLGRQMAEIERLALHDALTGLPNRTLLRQCVDGAIESGEETGGLAVLLLDLDRFKEINDTLGHESGDELLCAIADRLRRLVRDGDTVARLGGDEFAVVCRLTKGREEALLISERLQRGLEAPFAVSGMTLEVEASLGIALHPEHGSDVDALMRHADIAMYRAKDTRSTQVYCAETDHYSTQRLALAGELRQAIVDRQLFVLYQPLVDMATGELRKLEALVRWDHPQRGELAPAEFIPLAEQSGLARPLTRRILEDSLRDCRAWQDAGHAIPVSVNLFGLDLLDLGFPSHMSDLLADFDLDPRLLEVEITENTILTDPKRSHSILSRVTKHGVRIAVDDFGTGYSSLSHLSRLPVDVIKIDKSFVQRMCSDRGDQLIVRSTVDLAHNLGLEAVAEGVETEEQWDRLMQLRCDTAQGFYISRPIPGEQVIEWLTGWRASQSPSSNMRRIEPALTAAG